MLNSGDLYNGFYNVISNTNKYSENILIVSQQWTSVFRKFYMNQIAPIPGIANPNLFNALQIFQSGLMSSIQSRTIKEQFEILIQTLHLNIGLGVNMTGVYTTTFPVTPLKLQHCFNTNLSISAVSNLFANTIFLWTQTTFSVQNSSGAIIKWV